MTRKIVHSFAAALIALSVAATAFAGDATDVVKNKQTQLFDALGKNDDKTVDKLVNELLDYEAVVTAALADNKGKCSADELKSVNDTMKKLLQKSYRANLKKTVGWTVTYTTESKDGDTTVVKSTVTKGPESHQIDYKLSKASGSWKVVDISTDDVSMVSSWKGQFGKILNKDGCAGLIKKMQEKLAAP